jgi:hypothetical protein
MVQEAKSGHRAAENIEIGGQRNENEFRKLDLHGAGTP